MAGVYHRRVDIDPVAAAREEADGDQTVIAISRATFALDRFALQDFVQIKGRFSAAAIAIARAVFAPLRTLRRIDSMTPNALALDLDRVAVDDGRASSEGSVAGGRGRRDRRCGENGESRPREEAA
ncbi:MAG: hypothetical protein AAFU55_12015 [Pseudomonadota bacterium]